METLNFTPPEAMEMETIETKIFTALGKFAENIEKIKDKLNSLGLTEDEKEKLLEGFEKVKYGLLPIASKSIGFANDQYTQFSDLARRTNYSAQDVHGREAIMFTDMGLTLFVKALTATKEYIQGLN